MSYKSKMQPFCRYCGKAIPKHTDSHRLPGFIFNAEAPLVTLEDLKRKTNEEIVSVKYHYESERYEDLNPGDIYDRSVIRKVSGRRTVHTYSTWDGESYRDQFFCSGPCTNSFAYSAASSGMGTAAWRQRTSTRRHVGDLP